MGRHRTWLMAVPNPTANKTSSGTKYWMLIPTQP